MRIERESKISIAVTYVELFGALSKQFPTEFILQGFPTDPKLLSVTPLPLGIQITGLRRSQGQGEIEFNRMQRREETDGA
jgi:hypothetical protein